MFHLFQKIISCLGGVSGPFNFRNNESASCTVYGLALYDLAHLVQRINTPVEVLLRFHWNTTPRTIAASTCFRTVTQRRDHALLGGHTQELPLRCAMPFHTSWSWSRGRGCLLGGWEMWASSLIPGGLLPSRLRYCSDEHRCCRSVASNVNFNII